MEGLDRGGAWIPLEPRRRGAVLFLRSDSDGGARRFAPTFSNGVPTALFDAPVQPGYFADSHRWQVAPDGKRFLLLANAGKDQAPPLDVVVSWPRLLK